MASSWIITIGLGLVLCVGVRSLEIASMDHPCAYADTVNITDGLRLKDGSYSYAGVVVPPHFMAEYGFKVIDGVEYRAKKHLRGCVCLLKPCISFCCPPDLVFDAKNWNCSRPHQIRESTHIELTYSNNKSVEQVRILDRFVVRTELGCRNKFVDKKHESFWQWDLFENGSLQRDNRLWTPDEYCFTPLEHKSEQWELAPLSCERFQTGYRVWIYAICSIIAIIINIFILSLLGSVREARQSYYGKVIIYYLLCIVVGYSLLVYLALKNPMKLSHASCRNIGFLAYFCILLSFVFLAICSFDFLLNFRQKAVRDWVRRLWYGLSVLAVVGLRFLVSFAQDSKLPKHYKPGIGEDYCWFDVRLWGILIYYYAPITILLIFSIVCCLKAYFSIYELPPDTQYILGTQLRIVKTHFYAFSAYIVGVFAVWVREIVVYIMARVREHFFIIDFWSGICILGLAIAGFILLLGKNMHVKSWWAINVESSQTDLSVINARVYKFDEKGDLKSSDSPYKPTVTSL
ncbi:probable G-protein coupled receptor Mth-like 9 [Drosophila kikkawai]|uniref:Probable G-protein coupled receptor Mth-like 9 n=1 Tax=Drosophila kikkawai TaxID=30033 RepID=A0A6P4IZZ1_DROKI|nr:probable G-protein coupled receptor Mth-like 9 [Drosophila kikkawai]